MINILNYLLKVLSIFFHSHSCTNDLDNTTIFLNDENYVKELMRTYYSQSALVTNLIYQNRNLQAKRGSLKIKCCNMGY